MKWTSMVALVTVAGVSLSGTLALAGSVSLSVGGVTITVPTDIKKKAPNKGKSSSKKKVEKKTKKTAKKKTAPTDEVQSAEAKSIDTQSLTDALGITVAADVWWKAAFSPREKVLVVKAVRKNSFAADIGFQEGDVLGLSETKQFVSEGEFADALEGAKSGKSKTLRLYRRHQNKPLAGGWIEIDIAKFETFAEAPPVPFDDAWQSVEFKGRNAIRRDRLILFADDKMFLAIESKGDFQKDDFLQCSDSIIQKGVSLYFVPELNAFIGTSDFIEPLMLGMRTSETLRLDCDLRDSNRRYEVNLEVPLQGFSSAVEKLQRGSDPTSKDVHSLSGYISLDKEFGGAERIAESDQSRSNGTNVQSQVEPEPPGFENSQSIAASSTNRTGATTDGARAEAPSGEQLDVILDAMSLQLLSVAKANGIFAVKILSSSERPLDPELVQQLEISVAASVQKGSAFEAKIVPRATLDAVWQEQSDFSNLKSADFGEFVKKLQADYLIIVSVRPVPTGAEIAVQVVSTSAEGSQEVVYSMPTKLASIRTNTVVLSQDEVVETLKNIANSIEELGKLGGLVVDPKTLPEYYHNARIRAQRGEIDLALSDYEKVLASGILLADPVRDVVTLATRTYGKDGAAVFFDKKLKSVLPKALYLYGLDLLSGKPNPDVFDFVKDNPTEFPPLTFQSLNTMMRDYDALMWSDLVTMNGILNKLGESVKSGDFLAYYIDQIRGKSEFDSLNTWLINNPFETQLTGVRDVTESPVVLYVTYRPSIPKEGSRKDLSVRFGGFQDKMDMTAPLAMCADSGGTEKCIDVRTFRCKEGSRSIRWSGEQGCVPFEALGNIWVGPQDNGDGLNLAALLGSECVSRIVYRDQGGRVIDSRAHQISVSYEMREDYGGTRLRKQLEQCRYKIYESR